MTITADFCKKQLEKFDPDLLVTSIKDYGTNYLITYIYKGNDSVLDPFLLINKKSGEITSYTIADDPSKYYSTPDIVSNYY